MDFEAPADGWYVFIGVAIFSIAAMGLALSIPSTPPPNANGVANTIDKVGAQPYGGTARYEHDADRYWVNRDTVVLKNDGGTSRALVRFGTMAPAWPDEDLAAVVHGDSPKDVFADQAAFEAAVEAAQGHVRDADGRVFTSASGTLEVRKVTWGDYSVILVLA
ncbi:hypothetical protein G9C85_04685 [Halorubellus sp. JP-L1]|uniref:DUF7283 family protein n=1 Tax=Halorubellus sp. JP-L1 TaxID=2715753 RepID=UPI001407E2EC|nr:hypothetical protein [Halorubellus sp. JP-L1]NHN40932.1 hypothetical protein [Halorubellus sp. JP-L1]